MMMVPTIMAYSPEQLAEMPCGAVLHLYGAPYTLGIVKMPYQSNVWAYGTTEFTNEQVSFMVRLLPCVYQEPIRPSSLTELLGDGWVRIANTSRGCECCARLLKNGDAVQVWVLPTGKYDCSVVAESHDTVVDLMFAMEKNLATRNQEWA
jgi:hypothetical protein